MQKQGIKVPPTWLINFSASPSGLRADPGLHLSRARVSVAGTPGLKRFCKRFLTKEKPVLMKKEAVLTCFAPVSGRSLFLSYD